MTIDKAIAEACKQPTLLEALTWIAIWETERIVKQARENPTWETCFAFCFKRIFETYPIKRGSQDGY